MRDRRGFTLVEIVIVIVLIALMAAFAIPRIGDALVKQNIRSARVAITTLHAKARAYAIQRARQVALVTRNNEIYLISMTPVTDVVDTIDAPVNLNTRYGVTVTTNNDSIVFDPRGLGTATTTTDIVVSKNAYADTVKITPAGNIMQ